VNEAHRERERKGRSRGSPADVRARSDRLRVIVSLKCLRTLRVGRPLHG